MAKIIKKALYKSIGYTPSDILHIKKVPYPRIEQTSNIKLSQPHQIPLNLSREEAQQEIILTRSIKGRNRKIIFMKTNEGVKISE